MTITLNLPPETEQTLFAQAKARGLTLDLFFADNYHRSSGTRRGDETGQLNSTFGIMCGQPRCRGIPWECDGQENLGGGTAPYGCGQASFYITT